MLRSAMLAARSSGASPLRLGVAAGLGVNGSSSSRFAGTGATAPRLFSTSPFLAARADTGPTLLKDGTNSAPGIMDSATLNKQSAQALGAGHPEQLQPYPDYSKGPSALDKASQLFFFTEILRGEHTP